jgi:hypothetical protein
MKMYVLIRKDLSKSQQAVQGGHAVAEYLLNYKDIIWNNGTLVYLAIRNEIDLKEWERKFGQLSLNYSSFYEPDINNQITAIAIVTGDHLFKDEILL